MEFSLVTESDRLAFGPAVSGPSSPPPPAAAVNIKVQTHKMLEKSRTHKMLEKDQTHSLLKIQDPQNARKIPDPQNVRRGMILNRKCEHGI